MRSAGASPCPVALPAPATAATRGRPRRGLVRGLVSCVLSLQKVDSKRFDGLPSGMRSGACTGRYGLVSGWRTRDGWSGSALSWTFCTSPTYTWPVLSGASHILSCHSHYRFWRQYLALYYSPHVIICPARVPGTPRTTDPS